MPLKCKQTYWLTGLLLSLGSCEELVNPVLLTADPVLVVDAWLTNKPGETYLILTTTSAFDSPDPTPRVSDAIVAVVTVDRTIPFRELTPGFYIPSDPLFAGAPLARYDLWVTKDERVYQASSRMPLKPEVDSLTFRLRINEPFFEDGYFLVAHWQDPPFQRNFYFWEVFVNQRKLNFDEVILTDDNGVDGQYLHLSLPYRIPIQEVAPGDTLRIRLLGITEATYLYYQGLNALVQTGSPAQTVPQNPGNNLNNGALGFFAVAAADTASVTIP